VIRLGTPAAPLQIFYNSLEPLASVQSITQNTIQNYFDNIRFDANFISTDLIATLRALPFVNDVWFSQFYAAPNFVYQASGPWTPFMWQYASYAGYFIIDPNPLYNLTSSSIQYIAQ
jgi:hypothetical protein